MSLASGGVIAHHDPHCIAWAHATASFWGMAPDHDLDEPVQLTDELPVRVRMTRGELHIDRPLRLNTKRAGRHAALRFVFRDGSFREIEIGGLSVIDRAAKIVEVNICS